MMMRRGTKSDDPQTRDYKISRKREDDEEIISEMSTDSHMKCHAICVPTGRCVSASSSMFAYASGDPSRALSADEAENIISQTISSMTVTTATPSTSNNSADAIQAPSPWINQASKLASVSSIKNASILPFASGDPSRALSAEKAEEIISETISSMRATTTTPSTSNNPAGAFQAPPPWINQAPIFASASSIKNASIFASASGDSSRALSTHEAEEIISQTSSSMTVTPITPSTSNNPAGAIQAPPPPPRMNQASIIAYASADSRRALSTVEAEDIISQTISAMKEITTTPSTSNNPAGAVQAPPRPWINQPSIVASASSIKNASILPYSSRDSSRALSTDEAKDIISETLSSTTTPSTSNNPASAIQAPAPPPPPTAQALSKLNSLVTECFKGVCKILGDVIRIYEVSCDIPKQHNNALFIMDNSSPFNNDFPL